MNDITHLVKSALAKLVETFFLTLAALVSGTPYAIGLTLDIFMYAIGALSGCNLNPAVCLANVSKQRVQAGEVDLRKEVVTKQKTVNLPVMHKEAFIQRRQ